MLEKERMQSTLTIARTPGKLRKFRLYCFCYAGGNASAYLPWQSALISEVELYAIQLPGRGAYWNEKPYTSLQDLIPALATLIGQQEKMPFAFFGHSLGAMLAFELTRYCRDHALPLPEHLFMSGSDAPQYRSPSKRLHELPDDALIEALRKYDGTPAELFEHRDLMALVLPTIRADFALVANYQYFAAPLLNTPLTVFAGRHDEHVLIEHVEEWRRETSGNFRMCWFEGGHFFINSERQAVLAELNATLARLIHR